MTEATEQSSAPAASSLPPASISTRSHWLTVVIPALVMASLGWTIVYLFFTVPGKWFSHAPAQRFTGAQMKITRGIGQSDTARFIVAATDSSRLAVVTIDRPAINAEDYRRIRWRIVSADPEVTLVTVWRSGSAPGTTFTAPLERYGDDVFVARPRPPDWTGRIEGVALTIAGTLRQSLFIEEVTIDSMDASEIIADRIHDWFDFRHWNGLSINTAAGGPLDQPVWLPVAASIVALTAIVIVVVRGRRRMSASAVRLAIAAIVATTWIALDGAWLWGRFQQTWATGSLFAGKSLREKHIADVDGYAYAFAEQVAARLPKTPARIHIASDDHYFSGRLAYHLYPHNVHVDWESGGLPPPNVVKPGEYIIVFRRRGIQYDPANRMLAWEQQPPVPADVLIAHQGNAAFRLR